MKRIVQWFQSQDYFFKGRPKKLRDYWVSVMSSTQERISRGASHIIKIIPYARGENWRRGHREKKK